MIIDDFIKYGLEKENIEKAIEEIDFQDKYFWGNFRWGLYENKIFILFEYNRFYGNIVRQIAYIENGIIVKRDCSNGGTDDIVCSLLNCKKENKCITKYDIEELFKNLIND